MEIFHEEAVSRSRKSALSIMQYSMSLIVCVLSAAAAMARIIALSKAFTINDAVQAAIYIALFALTFYFRDSNSVEYEYALTNDELDFARIYGNRKRKQDFTVHLGSVIAAGFVHHENFRNFDKEAGVRRHNFFLHAKTPHYFLFFADKQNVRHMVVFEPSRELVNLIKERIPKERFFV